MTRNGVGNSHRISAGTALPNLLRNSQGCIDNLDDYDRFSCDRIREDLSMHDLNEIHGWLGIAGSFDNISPLHHQKLLQREILATTASRLHLIWFGRTIFLKPLPDCFVNSEFFTSTICANPEVYALVSGLLRSYCYMITCKVDLEMAKDLRLISREVTWKRWHAVRTSVIDSLPKDVIDSMIENGQMNKRWRYGELRLARLNWIYQFTGRGVVYFTSHREYGTYFSDYFKTFITVFAFLTTILSAMQVIVSVDEEPSELNTICYRFAVGALVLVAACFGSVLFLFLALFMYNAIGAFVIHMAEKGLGKSSAGKIRKSGQTSV